MLQRISGLLSLMFAVILLFTVAGMTDDSITGRIAKILQAEDSLQYDSFLADILKNKKLSATERAYAARAIGHIGDPDGSPALLRALDDETMDRALICRALGWLWANTPSNAYEINHPPAVKEALLKTAGRDSSLGVRAAAFEALALAYPGEEQVRAAQAAREFAGRDASPEIEALLTAVMRVAVAPKKKLPPIQELTQQTDPRATILQTGLSHPSAKVAYQAAYMAGRKQTFDVPLTDLLAGGVHRQEPLVRTQMLRAYTRREQQAAQEVIDAAMAMLSEGTTQEKIAAVDFIAKFLPPEKALGVLSRFLDDADTAKATSLHQAVLENLAGIKTDETIAYLWDVSQRKVPFHKMARVAAAKAGAIKQVRALSMNRYAVDREAALHYVEVLAAAALMDKLEFLIDSNTAPSIFAKDQIVFRLIVMELLGEQNAAKRMEVLQRHEGWLDNPDPIIRAVAVGALGDTNEIDDLKRIREAWRRAMADRSADVALSVMETLEAIADRRSNIQARAKAVLTEVARRGLEDSRLPVRRKAVAVLFATAREIHKAALYRTETGRSADDYQRLANRLMKGLHQARLKMITNKGEVTLLLRYDLAPLTADNFMRLATTEFYNGLVFHRVVPAFVVQGGDPERLGWSGPGYFIRDEEGMLPFGTGVLGMATAGHDTGGSQFFATVLPTPHLDGRYTAFGQVEGDNAVGVLEDLIPGDRIVKIERML